MPHPVSQSSSESLSASSENRADLFGYLVPVPFALLTFLMCIFPMRDTDFYWHVRTGELIWQNMSIPAIDMYTYTDFDKRWIDLHWCFQLLVSALYHSVGVNGIILFKAACYTFAVMLGWYCTGRSLPNGLKALIWFPALISISGRAYERPEMISLICLAGTLWLLERISRFPRLLFLVPVLLAIWTNFHALFILGVVVCGAYVAGGLIKHLLGSKGKMLTDTTLPTRSLILLFGLAASAPLLNPYLEEGWLFPLELYRKFSIEHDYYSPRVGEFQQPAVFLREALSKRSRQGKPMGLSMLFAGEGLIYPFAELTVLLFSISAGVWLFHRRKRLSCYRVLILTGFTHLAWVATRNTSVFALVGSIVTCGFLDDARVAADDRPPRPGGRMDQLSVIFITLMMGLVFSGEWGNLSESWKRFGFGEAPYWFGHDAVKFAGRPGMPKRAYLAHFGIAGTYIMHNGPEFKVFMDPRLEVCTRRTFEQWEAAMSLMANRNRGWEQIVNPDGKELPAVILDSRSSRPLINGMLMTPTWRLVFADPSAAVFIPVVLAEELGLAMADPRPLHKPPQ